MRAIKINNSNFEQHSIGETICQSYIVESDFSADFNQNFQFICGVKSIFL